MRYCTYFDEKVTEEDCQDCSENPEECEYLVEDGTGIKKTKHIRNLHLRYVS